MDTDRQLYETEATGWQRGLYDDVKHTFRAPIVNWIFRTTMANHPEFLRYAWGQVKPLFETRAFGEASVRYRDAVLSTLEEAADLPTYRRDQLDVAPAEFRELRGQLATFDVVAPRLAVLFEVMDRRLHDEAIGANLADRRAATEPLPAWLDRDRGSPPTMIAAGSVPEELDETVTAIREFHSLDDGLPSIYRCLAQWPGFLHPAWEDLSGLLESDAFDDACTAGRDAVEEYVDGAPYRPAIAPDDLARRGFDDAMIEDAQNIFRSFNRGPIETVIPALPVWAHAVDAEGERSV